MIYPKKLAEHTLQTFSLDKKTPDNEDIKKAYYHIDDYPINMHSHNFYEINIVVEGKGAHYVEDNVVKTRPGDVFAFPPGVKHGYWSEKDLKIFHLILPKYVLDKHSKDLEKFSGYHILFEIEPFIRKNYSENMFLKLTKSQLNNLKTLMDNMIDILTRGQTQEAKYMFELQSLLMIGELSHYINEKYQTVPVGDTPDDITMVKTIEFLRNSYYEKIKVDDLAKMANLSRSTYLRKFSSMMKKTPSEYLTEIRIKKSCEFLENAELSITYIAHACGFFDCSHFIRVFTKYNSTTPENYRKRVISRF